MTMNNASYHNEKLIELIGLNISERKNTNSIQVLRNTIFNQTIYPILRELHYYNGNKKQSVYRKNQAIALKMLRQIMPYNLACFCARNNDSDSLYHVINDYKFKLNSDFYTLFKSE